jgi:uncharacterized protein (TIGR02452 family)
MDHLVALSEEYSSELTEATYHPFTKERPAPPVAMEDGAGLLATVELDTFVAGAALKAAGLKPAVLNMANEQNVGGVWPHAKGSQEESLMRRSSLPLSLWPRRNPSDHRMRGYVPRKDPFFPLSETGVVYSPHVLVTRDESEELLPEAGRCTLSVITVAAQDMRWYTGGDTKFDEALAREKIRSILLTAVQNGHDAVVLGAFGCGAFLHDPSTVAALFADIISREFVGFRAVVFAVVFSQSNLQAFSARFPLLEAPTPTDRIAALKNAVEGK